MAQVFGWTATDMDKVIRGALKDYARDVANLLKQPTEAWQASFQPEFIVTEPEMEGNDLVCYAGVKPAPGKSTDDNVYPADVYKWVSRGTKSHNIAARKAPMLKFMSEYSPSTQPRSWSSSAPSYSGNLRVHRQVKHSGIEPRDYEEMAAEEMGPGLADYIQDRIGLLLSARAVPLGSALQEAENISATRGVRRPWRR